MEKNNYLKYKNKIIFFIKPDLKNIKKNYFIIKKLENKFLINKKNIIILIEKNTGKNNLYFLIIKNIFSKYNTVIIEGSQNANRK